MPKYSGYQNRFQPYPVNDALVPHYQPLPQPTRMNYVMTSGFARNRGYKKYRRGSTRDKFASYKTRTNSVYPKPEVKYNDVTLGTIIAPIAIPNTGTAMTALMQIGMDSEPFNRIGAQVAVKSVYYQCVFNFGTTTAAIAIRHCLVWDRQSNGVNPSAADVFGVPSLLLTSPLNLTNRQRFVMLADDRFTLSPNGDQIRIINGFRKINQQSTWEPTGTNNIPYTGNLLLWFTSDEATGATAPTVYGTWRIRYIDN